MVAFWEILLEGAIAFFKFLQPGPFEKSLGKPALFLSSPKYLNCVTFT